MARKTLWQEFKWQGKQLGKACTTDVLKELAGTKRNKKFRKGGNTYIVKNYFNKK